MEVVAGCQCVVCNTPSRPSLDMVRETFSASRTLEKTLEMLWGRNWGDSKVDTKRMFEEMTGKRGGLFCFPCLVVMHAGMGLVSEIMQLEERLCNLIRKITVDGAMISYKEAKISQDQQTNSSCYTDDIPSRTSTQQQCPARQRRDTILKSRENRDANDHTDYETTEKWDGESQDHANGLKESSKKRRNELSNSSAEDKWKSSKPQSIKTTPQNKESAWSAPLKSNSGLKSQKFTKIYGVQKCPSCDYKIDVRNPEQTAVSSDSLSPSVRALLMTKSRYKLATHFRDVHLGVSGMEKFTQMSSSGQNNFKCIECPFVTSTPAIRIVLHYICLHMRESPKRIRTRRSSLSCPEEGCSFVSVLVKPGRTWKQGSDLQMRNRLSSHVIRYHDRLRLSAGKCQVNAPLLVETEDKSKELRCTRCEYTQRLPEKLFFVKGGSYNTTFLRHFFKAHLKDLISNQY